MASETVTYLVALSLPVWLVAEQVNSWWRSPKPPERQIESGTASGAHAPDPLGSLANSHGVPPARQPEAA